MKKSFLLAGGFALALFFAACGDDSSSGNSVDQETDESSSSVEDSTDVSSSSKEQKDPSVPEGARKATLEDLNWHQLIEIKGEQFLLATGNKTGVFALWTTDSAETIANQNVLVVRSNFGEGKLKIDANTAFMPYGTSVASKKGTEILEGLIDSKASGLEISFIVEDSTLKYNVGKSDYKKVKLKDVDPSPLYVKAASKLADKRLACEFSDDTTMVFSFYKGGRYIAEQVVKGDTVSWNAGYMDVFYDLTFMLSDFAGPANVQTRGGFGYKAYYHFYADLSQMTDISKTAEISCVASDLKYTPVKETDVVGKWSSFEDGKIYWKLDLGSSNKYTMTADDGAKENKSGAWAVYGNQLLLDVTTCSTQNCALGIKGPLTKVSDKGFTYNHSDKGSPAVPKTWEVPNLQ